MESKEIEAGNKLVAEFMTLQMHDTLSLAKTPIKAYEWNCNLYSLTELKFHYSWDWLMLVVEKIESLGYKTVIMKSTCSIYNSQYNVNPFEAESKIQAVYAHVVDFIHHKQQIEDENRTE